MPPDDSERSELDEVLFSAEELDDTPERGARPYEPEADLSELDAKLFGEFGPGAGPDTAEIPPDGRRRPGSAGRARRFGLGFLVVLLVLGLGGLAYAAFGGDDGSTPKKAKVEVRGPEATSTTLRTTTTSSTTTTSTTTATTTAPPATTDAPVVAPETDPPVTEPPPPEPPPTEPAPPEQPPPEPTTAPPTTTST